MDGRDAIDDGGMELEMLSVERRTLKLLSDGNYARTVPPDDETKRGVLIGPNFQWAGNGGT